MKAAELLEAEGIHARVLNIHTIKPLDTELPAAVLQHALEQQYAALHEQLVSQL